MIVVSSPFYYQMCNNILTTTPGMANVIVLMIAREKNIVKKKIKKVTRALNKTIKAAVATALVYQLSHFQITI